MRLPGLGERGNAAIEFALAVPILALLFGSVFEVGRVAQTAAVAREAAREGARYAAVGDVAETPQQRALDYLNQALSGRTDVTLPSSGSISVTYATRSATDESVTVAPVTVNVHIYLPIVQNVVGATLPVTGSATMRVQP